MKTALLSRRTLLGLGLASAAAGGISACGVGTPQEETSGRLRATWWGGDNQNQALNAALDAFAESNEIEISRESLPWDGYWDKLATQAAARNAPDLVMQAGSQIPDYSSRGALLDLNEVGAVRPDVVDEGLQTFGMVEDELFGVVAAANAMCLAVNRTVGDEASITIPDGPWSWDDLAEIAVSASESLGEDRWGIADAGGDLIAFILYLRANGQELYADDGSLNPVETQLTEWFTLWEDLRRSGGTPPADVTAEGGGPSATSPLARQRVAMASLWTQNFTSVAALVDEPWTIHLPPYAADSPSLWMNAASLWSISATSGNAEAAGELIDYLLTDEEAVTTIGGTLGTPPTQSGRDLLQGTLGEAEQQVTDYMGLVSEQSRPLNRLWPAGFVELRSRTAELNEAVGFGELEVGAAVEAFLETASES